MGDIILTLGITAVIVFLVRLVVSILFAAYLYGGVEQEGKLHGNEAEKKESLKTLTTFVKSTFLFSDKFVLSEMGKHMTTYGANVNTGRELALALVKYRPKLVNTCVQMFTPK